MSTSSVGDLLEHAAAMLWAAYEEQVSGLPWQHAGPWRQRKYLRMAQTLYKLGLLVDPAIGRDLNRLQTSRDEWRGRAQAAEKISQLDRKRANDAARESSSARADAEAFLQLANDGREELEAARDRADALQRTLDLVVTEVEDEARKGYSTARTVLGIIRRDET